MTKQNTTNTKTVHKAVVEMDTFFKKMEDIRVFKETFHYKKSTMVDGIDWIEYTSKDLLDQARAMAMIMGFQYVTAENPEEPPYAIGINIYP